VEEKVLFAQRDFECGGFGINRTLEIETSNVVTSLSEDDTPSKMI
jgi:hypothetical protein